jgi:hypothetical protein
MLGRDLRQYQLNTRFVRSKVDSHSTLVHLFDVSALKERNVKKIIIITKCGCSSLIPYSLNQWIHCIPSKSCLLWWVKSFNKQDTFCYNAFAKCFITQHHLFSYVRWYDVSSKNMITMVWSHLYPSSQVRITLLHKKKIWDFLKSFRSIQPAVKIVAKTLLLFGTVQLGYLTPL